MSAQLLGCQHVMTHLAAAKNYSSLFEVTCGACCRCFFLQRPRLELFERIDLRVEQMVDRGLLQVGHSAPGLLSYQLS